jgi:hypothetical protein
MIDLSDPERELERYDRLVQEREADPDPGWHEILARRAARSRAQRMGGTRRAMSAADKQRVIRACGKQAYESLDW